ncbi:hypothetical protein GIX77_08915 [Lactobacillus reuteri]|uniref:SHOCT domain-containing protein n=1 Tax=Limosilactobacillus reuteri TaxID=1598 RepID=A0A7X2G5A2_LIMRT|nr:SHOCT domain-containing protein [Limosilactobacillus reuteri]MCC4342839.1 SHOCT domain-containing protein [Limosilactobacillus reuteri]MRH72690.1 hypothetical protein [Limosilactobacillus reuteri]MRH80880.1 hypothetical protein [Limosilactobacillus reuteri]
MQKTIILKRLITGIILLLVGLWVGYIGISFSSMGVTYDYPMAVSYGGDEIILASANLIIGITFISTCYMFPKKWLDYILVGLGVILYSICLTEFSQNEITSYVTWIFFIISVACLLIGIPWSKNGYKTMPYQTKNSVKKNTQKDSSDYMEQIAKLKKLLDDNAITQEEYDAKKKQLLNL